VTLDHSADREAYTEEYVHTTSIYNEESGGAAAERLLECM